MITITDNAAQHINSQIEKRLNGYAILLGVQTTGCSGFAYVLEFYDDRDTIPMEHTMYKHNGVCVLIKNEHKIYLEGITVDFGKEGLNEGLKFINPNVKDECGCGESFTV